MGGGGSFQFPKTKKSALINNHPKNILNFHKITHLIFERGVPKRKVEGSDILKKSPIIP